MANKYKSKKICQVQFTEKARLSKTQNAFLSKLKRAKILKLPKIETYQKPKSTETEMRSKIRIFPKFKSFRGIYFLRRIIQIL